jgi:hypothetical protein
MFLSLFISFSHIPLMSSNSDSCLIVYPSLLPCLSQCVPWRIPRNPFQQSHPLFRYSDSFFVHTSAISWCHWYTYYLLFYKITPAIILSFLPFLQTQNFSLYHHSWLCERVILVCFSLWLYSPLLGLTYSRYDSYTQNNTNTEKADTDIYASSGIRTQDHSVRAGEDGSCLRLRHHCDW